MSISMKDVDPAFQQQQGVGIKIGLEIWEIENEHLLALPKGQYGQFYSGKAYIILQTRALRSGVLHHEIHYWIGKCAEQIKTTIAATKAVELAASLGSRAIQNRELEGYESDKFLSYFRPCFIPIPTTNAAAEEITFENRMFLCQGRHVARVTEVPCVRSSLDHDHVFVLNTKFKLFQFNGSNTDLYERTKALDVLGYLRDKYHKEKCHVATIEDGKFVADVDSGEFWGHFGGFAPLTKKAETKEYEVEAHAGVLFVIYENQADKVQYQSLERDMLSTSKSYVLDCGNELFVWMGRDTSLQDRKAAVLVAQEMANNTRSGKSQGIKLLSVMEGFEPLEFRSKFTSWPMNTMSLVAQGGRGKLAVLLKQKGFNVNGLLKVTPTKQNLQHFSSNNGKLQVWQVNESSKERLLRDECSKFYSSSCYVVLHTSADRKEHLVCAWLGHQSIMETRESCMEYANEMASSLQENVVQMRLVEGNEPTQFLSLFEMLFIIKSTNDRVNLFQVHQSGPRRWRAIQVDADSTFLNSSSCFFLQVGETLYTWYGKFSSLEEQEATKNMVYHLRPNATLMNIKEGLETHMFWNMLGGRRSYPDHHEPKDSAKDPRLFSCQFKRGELKLKEIFNFTREDFMSDEIMIVDCHTDIFVWVGLASSPQLKLKSFELGQEYIKWAAKYEGVSMEAPIYKITEGCEPTIFTSICSWDSSVKGEQHLNSFERKLSSLKRESAGTQQILPAQLQRAASDSKTFQQTINKERLNTSFTLKPSNLMDRGGRAAKTAVRYGRPVPKSPTISLLSGVFEAPKGREAPPNTPIVNLSVRTPRFVEPSGNSPPATPRHSRTPGATPCYTSATPRHRKTPSAPQTPAIATLASSFEAYEDRFAFAWPGMYPRYDEKPNQDNDADHDEEAGEVFSGDGDDDGDGDSEASKVTKQPSVTKLEEAYPYDRLKVSSSNPVVGIDTSKRESYLSHEEFQEVFHMDKDTFYKLPRWKQDKYKAFLNLF